MITDERLDQLIRAALEREAETAAEHQPGLHEAVNRVASRLAPATRVGRPRLILAPGETGTLNLLTLVLLLTALLALALYIGSLLFVPPPPPPFGFAGSCQIDRMGGLAFDEPRNEMIVAYEELAIYADGRWVEHVSQDPQTAADEVTGAAILQRRLSPRGLRLLDQRILATGLTPGNRQLATDEAQGSLDARTSQGLICARWGPVADAYSYRLDEEHEARLVELTAALKDPQDWLPPEAWQESAARRLTPDHWLVLVTVRPYIPPPDQPTTLPNGEEVEGDDPRYALVEMPGGAEPIEFGVPVPVGAFEGPGSTARCGSTSLDETVALASSIDALERGPFELGTDEHSRAVYGPGLTTTVEFGWQPIYGAGYDCVAMVQDREWLTEPLPTSSPPPVVGELAGFDPCLLVPSEAAAALGTDTTTRTRSRLLLGLSANACVAVDSSVPPIDDPSYQPPPNEPPPGWRASVTLYPVRQPRAAVPDLLKTAYGSTPAGGMRDGHPVWTVACDPPSEFCADVLVGWADSRVLLFEFTTASTFVPGPDPNVFGPENWQREVTPEMAADFVRAVLDQVLATDSAP
ncbi:hypothetical protein BH23CHL7_BH23CHL7_07270 [soil metagenome]